MSMTQHRGGHGPRVLWVGAASDERCFCRRTYPDVGHAEPLVVVWNVLRKRRNVNSIDKKAPTWFIIYVFTHQHFLARYDQVVAGPVLLRWSQPPWLAPEAECMQVLVSSW